MCERDRMWSDRNKICHSEWVARKDVCGVEVVVTEAGRMLSAGFLINKLLTKVLFSVKIFKYWVNGEKRRSAGGFLGCVLGFVFSATASVRGVWKSRRILIFPTSFNCRGLSRGIEIRAKELEINQGRGNKKKKLPWQMHGRQAGEQIKKRWWRKTPTNKAKWKPRN